MTTIQLRHLLILILMLSFNATVLFAQQERKLIYKGSVQDLETLGQYAFPKSVSDSLPAISFFNELINTLHTDGYLLSAIDTLIIEDKKLIVEIIIGDRFRWAMLNSGNVSEEILNEIGYREKFYKKKVFNHIEINRLLKKVISFAENNGYPFASIRLDSMALRDQEIEASLNYQSGPFITFDTVKLEGTSKSKPLFISNFLRIKPGSPYEEKKVEQARSKLRRLPYLKVSESPYVTFQLQQGTPHLNLVDVKANQVDGIIGLMPNEGGGGGALITGQFDLLLQNLLGTGKVVSLNWQRTQVNSQNLDIHYEHPNLLKSPLNFKAGFSLLKEDTLFINRNFNLGASVLVGKYSRIAVFTDIKSANTIANFDGSLEIGPEHKQWSQLADFNLTQYGFGYDFNSLDNLWLPTRGTSFELEASVGNKKMEGSMNGVVSGDSLDSKLVQYNFKLALQKYFPVSKRFFIKSSVLAGSVISEQLYYNDLFRIGGLKSIRGFVENEFFVSDFAIASAEAQYLIDDESYMFLFYDQGYVYADMAEELKDYPAGLGAGLTFTTNAGTFSFVYALGRTSSQSFNVNFSKIHFGYITRF